MNNAEVYSELLEGPLLPEIGAEAVDEAVKADRPFVVRCHPDLAEVGAVLTVASLKSVLGDEVISVEHKHRWNSMKEELPASNYFKQIEETDFYWRQNNLRNIGLLLPKLPVPASIRADVTYFDNLWVGPKGTIQTFHQDNHDDVIANGNLFCQILGCKYIAMAAPEDSEYFLSHPLNQHTNRHSSASPFDAETVRMCPSFVQAMLRSGDLVYVPPRYWHYIQSFSVSVSISRWWFNSRLAEMLYASAVGVHDCSSAFVGKEAWSDDLAEIGGYKVLHDYIQRLSNIEKYAFNMKLVHRYGEGALNYDGKGRG